FRRWRRRALRGLRSVPRIGACAFLSASRAARFTQGFAQTCRSAAQISSQHELRFQAAAEFGGAFSSRSSVESGLARTVGAQADSGDVRCAARSGGPLLRSYRTLECRPQARHAGPLAFLLYEYLSAG